MKRQQRCPKCDGKRIWVIESFRIPNEVSDGAVLAVDLRQRVASTGFLALQRTRPIGHFDLYVCAGCGFSELWASEIRSLREDPERGVRLLDSTTDPEGPFR